MSENKNIEKHILFVLHRFTVGGAEKMVAQLSNYFSNKNRCKVTIVLFKEGLSFDLDEKIRVHVVGGKGIHKYLKLRSLIKELKPSVVITTLVNVNVKVLPFLLGLKTKIIAWEANHYYAADLFRRFLRRITYKIAREVVVLTERDADNYTNWCESVNVIGSSFGKCIENVNFNRMSYKTFLTIGTMKTEQKGIDLLIRSLTTVFKVYPDWRAVIIGDGPLRQKYNELACNLNIDNKIEFAGTIKDLEEYYLKSSIYLMSSRWEGWPLVLGEAMAHGLPVVSFDCPTGPGDVIKDRHNGILVEERDTDKFAASVIELIETPGLSVKIAEQGYHDIKKYGIVNIANEWMKIIE